MCKIRVYPEDAAFIKSLHAFPSGEASSDASFEQGTFQHAVLCLFLEAESSVDKADLKLTVHLRMVLSKCAV